MTSFFPLLLLVSLHQVASIRLRRSDMLPDDEADALIRGAYDWCTNLGSPAALVAGAVLATNWSFLELRKQDKWYGKLGRKLTKFLFLSAFAMEVTCIFVTTVTGTMLLSRTPTLLVINPDPDATPVSFLRDNFEFEYLTARITFLQGLLNWLSAIALGLAVDSSDNRFPSSTRKMNRFISAALVTTVLLMLSFYNKHMTFYDNYGNMLMHWATSTWTRLVWCWPMRPLALLFVPAFCVSGYLGIVAFHDDGSYGHDDGDDDDDENRKEETDKKKE